MIKLTQKELKKYILYDPETGKFTWLAKTSKMSRIIVGTEVGHRDKLGIYRTKLFNKPYQLHDIAYLYMLGYIPKMAKDYIDGDKENLTWSNLRLASRADIQHKTGISKRNKIGVKGLYIRDNHYECEVTKDKKSEYKCFKFNELLEAITWIRETRIRLHGEFVNLQDLE